MRSFKSFRVADSVVHTHRYTLSHAHQCLTALKPIESWIPCYCCSTKHHPRSLGLVGRRGQSSLEWRGMGEIAKAMEIIKTGNFACACDSQYIYLPPPSLLTAPQWPKKPKLR